MTFIQFTLAAILSTVSGVLTYWFLFCTKKQVEPDEPIALDFLDIKTTEGLITALPSKASGLSLAVTVNGGSHIIQSYMCVNVDMYWNWWRHFNPEPLHDEDGNLYEPWNDQ